MNKKLRYFVREQRTPDERKEIYNKLRELGVTRPWAARVRDWTNNHVSVFIETVETGVIVR